MTTTPRLIRGAAAVAAAALALTGVAGATAATADTPAPQTVVYVEVNDNDLSAVADYTLEGTNRGAFDIAAIFAANINYDGTQAYLHLNDRVTWTLQNADTQIRPVQAHGTKVVLSILGNHQGAGFANFTTPAAADAFAAQLADTVTAYGLDGIDFDDEWTQYGVNGTPDPNPQSFGWLLTALRDRLGPDKLITLYGIGPSHTTTDWAAIDAAALLDYAWNPWYGTYFAPSGTGLGSAQLGAAAVDLSQQSAATAADFAARTVADGYGAYVTYNLTSRDQSAYISGITEIFHGKKTIYRQPPVDDVAPTAAIRTGGQFTALHGQGPSYNKVTFTLSDDTALGSATINGVTTTLTGASAVLGPIKPNTFGAVRGANTLIVTDAAGNTSTTTFDLK